VGGGYQHKLVLNTGRGMDTDQGELLQALLRWLATFSVEAGGGQLWCFQLAWSKLPCNTYDGILLCFLVDSLSYCLKSHGIHSYPLVMLCLYH